MFEREIDEGRYKGGGAMLKGPLINRKKMEDEGEEVVEGESRSRRQSGEAGHVWTVPHVR